MIEIQSRSFRQQITIPEMIKMQFWDIYFVQDNTDYFFGEAYRPCDITVTGGNQRSRLMNKENVGTNVRILANDEIWHVLPNYKHAEAFGNSDTDLIKSYTDSINSFIKQFPASFVHPWTITNMSVYSYRWYLTTGPKVYSGNKQYQIANGDFLEWLFIDDGAGNIINSNGVMYRFDFINSGICSFENWLPKENIYPENESVILKSTDYNFLYPGCSPNLVNNRIYTGDSD